MSAAIVTPHAPASPDPASAFLAVLPEVERRARAAFRRVRNYHDREDAVAEAVARAWQACSALPGCLVPAALAAAAVAAVAAAMTATG